MSAIYTYPQFTPLDLDHRPFFNAAFKDNPPEISEFTFTNLFSWRQAYGYQLSLLDGLIILQATAGKSPCFLQPIGSGELAGVIKQILGDRGGEFCRIPESLVRIFENNPDIEIREDRDNSDYLYFCTDLVDLGGRKYDGKRNLIKKFKSQYTYDYHDIKSDNAKQILEFEQAWCSIKGCDIVEGLNNERQAIGQIVDNFKEFELRGAIIEVENKICAIAIAETLNPETLVMHILKADPAIPGLYQVMLNDFLRYNAGDFKYVNLEQDLGIAGLRASKESYQPVKLIKKYTLSLKK